LLLGSVAALGVPMWFARDWIGRAVTGRSRRHVGSNERLAMAAIGVGTNRTRRQDGAALAGARGVAIMKKAMHEPGVQMVAVCDVDRLNAEFAQDLVRNASRGGSRDCQVITDFRRLLEQPGIDAVTIGTPDHWHAAVAIAAMRAGKDVYCEKPMTLTIEEGQKMLAVARQTGRIVQVGMQQRTEFAGQFRLAAELVRNGRLGRVRQVTTLIGLNFSGGPFEPRPVPEHLDWNFWLGPLPHADYIPQRCHYDFRWWYESSGGKMTDWGVHHNDIVQWALAMDESGPIRVSAVGAPPANSPRSFNCHPSFEVTYVYGNGPGGSEGTRLICRSAPPTDWSMRETVRGSERLADNGILFEGDDDRWLFVSRNGIQASERQILDEPLGPDAERLPNENEHMGNFIDCVREGQTPICHAGVGHRSASVCHLGVIALRFFPGKKLQWNPAAERFTGADAEAANRHLSRPRRAEWDWSA